jgi:N-methylhydantoinase A
LNIPIKHEFSRVVLGKLSPDVWSLIDPVYDNLAEQARIRLRADGFLNDDVCIVREIELRHPGQIGTLRIALMDGGETDRTDRIKEDFLVAYERSYGHRDTKATIEIAGVRVIGMGRFVPFELQTAEIAPAAAPLPASTRQVYFDEAGGWIEADIYRGSELGPGQAFAGPAIIEEETTSIVVLPGDKCTVDALGNFLIRFGKGTTGET